ncbi:MAG: YihY/virulence factor BrkB family protein [Tepidiformaceae bacterium]
MTFFGVSPATLAKRVFSEYKSDDVSGLAAELSYRFFFALAPFLLFLAALGGFIASASGTDNPTQRVIDALDDRLPADARSVLEGQLEGVLGSQSPGLLSIGIIGAIWAASGGFGAIMKAMNRAYDVPETRPFWKRYALSVVFTILAGGTMLLTFVVMLAAGTYGQEVAHWVGLGSAFELTIVIARFPLAVVLVMAAMAFLYWKAPNIDVPFAWVSPGAVLFTITWLLATTLFGLYVAHFASYNATYGALGGVIVLLLWFYLSSVVMLLGAEINAIGEEVRDAKKLEASRERVIAQASACDRRKEALAPAPPAKESAGRL